MQWGPSKDVLGTMNERRDETKAQGDGVMRRPAVVAGQTMGMGGREKFTRDGRTAVLGGAVLLASWCLFPRFGSLRRVGGLLRAGAAAAAEPSEQHAARTGGYVSCGRRRSRKVTPRVKRPERTSRKKCRGVQAGSMALCALFWPRSSFCCAPNPQFPSPKMLAPLGAVGFPHLSPR